MSKSAYILALIAFIAGCSSKIEVQGEVFLDSNGVATKLANVDIQIVPEDKFSSFIKSRLLGVDSEIDSINSNVKNIEEGIVARNKSARDIEEAQRRVIITSAAVNWNINSLGGQYMKNQNEMALSNSNSVLRQTADAVVRDKRVIEDLRKSIEGLKTGKNGRFYYSDKIPGAIAKTSTNADGKFRIEVTSEKRVALVASKGDDYWFLWIAPKGSGNINLTNTNSIKTNCDTCIFDGKTTPSALQ